MTPGVEPGDVRGRGQRRPGPLTAGVGTRPLAPAAPSSAGGHARCKGSPKNLRPGRGPRRSSAGPHTGGSDMATSADVLIRDTLSDSGAEPSSGAWWGSPDIVVRANDDDVFANQPAVRGQKNFIYVRVRNNGPETATDVNVSVRAVAYA